MKKAREDLRLRGLEEPLYLGETRFKNLINGCTPSRRVT